MHLFGRNSDHDYYCELLFGKRCFMPCSLLSVLLHTIAISGCLFCLPIVIDLLPIVPSRANHPIQTNGIHFSPHRDFGGFPCSVGLSSGESRRATQAGGPDGDDLRCFYQQKAQHRTALLGNVSQSATIPA